MNLYHIEAGNPWLSSEGACDFGYFALGKGREMIFKRWKVAFVKGAIFSCTSGLKPLNPFSFVHPLSDESEPREVVIPANEDRPLHRQKISRMKLTMKKALTTFWYVTTIVFDSMKEKHIMYKTQNEYRT